MIAFIQGRNPQTVATLDQDATLVETTKRDALYSYKGYKAHQPLNTWWAEQVSVLHAEFRDGKKLIHWHRERCGKSEKAHSAMKEDLAGGKLPSDDFGENAAWWPSCAVHADKWIMILAMNLNSSMKRLALEKSWAPKRMKAIRFSFINTGAYCRIFP